MTCRDEILDCFNLLEKETNKIDFKIPEIIECMKIKGTEYKETTIRTHITSRMCANAPDHHGTTYDDLIRTERGKYRLERKKA